MRSWCAPALRVRALGAHGQVRTEEELASRLDDHARILDQVADSAIAWAFALGRQAGAGRTVNGQLGGSAAEDERRAYLPLIVRAPAEALGAVDAIWYVRGRFTFLIEVEWTAMFGDPVLRRGRGSPGRDQGALLSCPPSGRSWCAPSCADRRGCATRWSARTGTSSSGSTSRRWPHGTRRSLDWLEPVLGLDPLIERGGEQLTMFGE